MRVVKPWSVLPLSRRRLTGSVLSSLVLSGALGIGRSSFAQTPAASLDALYGAARHEGPMTWYISFYGQDVADRTVAAFEKKYPGLKVYAVRRTTGSTFQRVEQDLQVHSNIASVLTMSGIGDYYGQLKREGHLADYTPENAAKLSPKVTSTVDPGYVYPVGGGLMAIAYNSKNVTSADAPQSWNDLTNPKWKGKLALSHPAFSGFDAALDVWLMRTKGWDFFKALAKNNPLIQRSTFETVTALNSGESWVGTMPDEVAIESARKGNPVRIVYPSDGSVLILGFTAILKNAPQPNTAKLFTEFLLGTEHAKILAAAHYVSVRPEVPTPLTGGKDISTIPVVPLRPSQQFAKDLAVLIERWRDLFGS